MKKPAADAGNVAKRMTAPDRRSFLKSSLRASALVTLAPLAPRVLCRTALAAAPRDAGPGAGTILVAVQLSGGNDGLNCVVPYADDAYARRRASLRLTGREVLRIDDSLGLHPAMASCRALLEKGSFGIVQGVGYPESSRDHPAAKRDWQTALPGDDDRETGWLGRVADGAVEAAAPAAVPVALAAQISMPLALRAERAVIPKLPARDAGILSAAKRDPEHERRLGALAAAGSPAANPLLESVRESAAAAWRRSARIREVSEKRGGAAARYPASPFGQRLKQIADLIRAEAGYRIFFTDHGGDGFGGFDNHANQKDNHAALLKQFSEAVAAFLADLEEDGLDDRVVLMTVSEFGRTVTENGRGGTDHGAAAPVFLAGGALRGGVAGAHPRLDELDRDALRFHTDFRSVYATVLERWLGIASEPVLEGRFETLDLFRT